METNNDSETAFLASCYPESNSPIKAQLSTHVSLPNKKAVTRGTPQKSLLYIRDEMLLHGPLNISPLNTHDNGNSSSRMFLESSSHWDMSFSAPAGRTLYTLSRSSNIYG
jgi:hypothetical protein